MFDTNAEITIDAPARIGGKLHLRFPTDAEWNARSRARKFITRRLGRGKSLTEPPKPGEPDLKLYGAICINGTPPLSAAEASMVLEALGQCTVLGVEIEGNEATVRMNVPGGEVVHRLKVPTADQILENRTASFRLVELPFNQQEIAYSTESGARIWDACEGKAEGYAAAIPGPHKAEAVRAASEFVEQRLGPSDDDTSF